MQSKKIKMYERKVSNYDGQNERFNICFIGKKQKIEKMDKLNKQQREIILYKGRYIKKFY